MRTALLGVILLCGCAAPDFPAPTGAWKTHTGQLQYVTGEHSVIGEFTASRQGNDFRLEFTKGGAVPLIRVAIHEGNARAEGPMARGRWRGATGKAPTALRGWLVEVPRAFLGLEPILTASGGPQISASARRMQVRGTHEGERFVFVFDR